MSCEIKRYVKDDVNIKYLVSKVKKGYKLIYYI